MSALAFALYPLAAVLGLALALLVALVVLPFHVEARGALDDAGPDGRLQVRWGGYLAVVRLDSAGLSARVLGVPVWRYRGGRDASARAEKRARRAEKRSKTKRRGTLGPRSIWRHRAGLLELARSVAGALPVRGHLYGTIGLRDPGETAAVFALFDQLAQRSAAVDIDVRPDWIDETVDLDGALSLRVWIVHLAAAVIWRLVTDGRARRGAWALVRSN